MEGKQSNEGYFNYDDIADFIALNGPLLNPEIFRELEHEKNTGEYSYLEHAVLHTLLSENEYQLNDRITHFVNLYRHRNSIPLDKPIVFVNFEEFFKDHMKFDPIPVKQTVNITSASLQAQSTNHHKPLSISLCMPARCDSSSTEIFIE